MSNTYYCFYFPCPCLLHHNPDKKEELITQIVQRHLHENEYKKDVFFYVFFDEFLLFCQNYDYIWYINSLHCQKTINELYERLNPNYKIRKLSEEELIYIKKATGHSQNYDAKNVKSLVAAIVNTAIDDALSFQRPRNEVEYHRDYEKILQNKPTYKKYSKNKDIRPPKEKEACEARLFLLEKNYYLKLYLSILGIDIDSFIRKMEKKIKDYDRLVIKKRVRLNIKKEEKILSP